MGLKGINNIPKWSTTWVVCNEIKMYYFFKIGNVASSQKLLKANQNDKHTIYIVQAEYFDHLMSGMGSDVSVASPQHRFSPPSQVGTLKILRNVTVKMT